MAEAIISVVGERLLAIAEEKIRNEVSLVRGVKKEARKLSDELRSVRKVLDDAERKGVKEESIREWLKKLEYASYEMDDVLDEWNFSRIKLQKEQQDSSAAASPQDKVCSFIPHSSCLSCKKIATRRDIALKIKHVKAKLDMILKERNRDDFLENKGSGHSLERVTTSFVEIDDIKGRDIDRDNLVSKIISHSTSTSQGGQSGPIYISSIVGAAGIGKTTLAQLVYNDSRVRDYFPLRIWVCVSDPLDEVEIAKEILEQVSNDSLENPSTNRLQMLLTLLEKSFSGKKFLLVLDDVWNGDDAKWGPLKSSLKSGCAEGSRFLVTTRNKMVATNIGTNQNDIHHLGQLSKKQCWSLLSQIAFSGRNDETKKGLLDIGQKIALKCKGLPLAAKTLGSLLRFKNTVDEWEDVLNSEIWQLESTKEDLFPHLLLSYNDLPPAQKRCFSYCAVFPKGRRINVDGLIRKWIALGYLNSGGGHASELELKGREYFNNLANRCLFQNFEKDWLRENVIDRCKMHDIVHGFAKSLREEDDLMRSDEASTCNICSPLASRVRLYRSLLLKGNKQSDLHVCDHHASARVLDCRMFRNISIEIEKFIHLRNLRFKNVDVNENDVKSICMLYNLKSLVLVDCGLREIPSVIANLSQLRHLNLNRNGELKELPESTSKLYELRSLNVKNCINLSELPQGIDGLINLKHLVVTVRLSRSENCLKFPQGLAKLTSLQTLEGTFNGGSDWSKLGLLNKLNRLSGSLRLRIKLVDDDHDMVEQAREADLRKKMYLQKLVIRFRDRLDKKNEESMRRRFYVMDALQPHPNLQSLTIELYKGYIFPEWIASPPFPQLREINLINCYCCSSLPQLAKLSCLEELKIQGFDDIEFVPREFLGITSSSIGFPKLKKLVFDDCRNWKEWDDITVEEQESVVVSVMPCLIQLEIYCCHRLRALPHRLLRKASSLQKLVIDCSPHLQESYNEGGRLAEFISHIPNVDVRAKPETRYGTHGLGKILEIF